MKNEKLLDAMGQIDDQLILEAAEIKKSQKQWVKWWVAAACLAVAVLAGVLLLPAGEAPLELPQLPMLSISGNETGAWGYEGYCAYDISELVSANPWNEKSKLTVLPVYQNAQTGDVAKMEAWAEEIADRLGMHDSNFSKMLRHHLTLEKEKQIIKIIDTIAEIHGR